MAVFTTPVPPLSRPDVERLSAIALACARQLVAQADIERGPVRWQLESQVAGVSLYKGDDVLKTSTSGLYCGITDIHGTLDEVLDLFRTDTIERAKDYCQRIDRSLLDAVQLFALATPPGPRISVKWLLTKRALGSFVSKRDASVVECDQVFTQHNGQRGWVRAIQSVPLSSCPSFEATMGYIRATHRGTGHVFLESDHPKVLHAIYICNVDLGGHVAEWVATADCKQRCRQLADLDLFLRENRLSRGGRWLHPDDMVPVASRSHCHLCHKAFGVFRKPSRCRRCGEVLCSTCNVLWNVKVGTHWQPIRACVVCSLRPPPETPTNTLEGTCDPVMISDSACLATNDGLFDTIVQDETDHLHDACAWLVQSVIHPSTTYSYATVSSPPYTTSRSTERSNYSDTYIWNTGQPSATLVDIGEAKDCF
ncbi:Aste57867_16189 [Aphanomyces stellatus]|uniref:Aste57867_16189 protein n=1 Tax=Aphanomyces stellatus TaxID=120398 RepID=A0A485L548_9STRA|nr:hypothetical protein As57867_016133 [Aphanomyces stellatus]VFT92967.1 Aste57867_16189 [Aphanomyces stellatus]